MKKVNKDFCMFILSYGRANRIYTLKVLEKANYTGPYFIIVGEDDKEKNEYIKLYGNKVIMFDKNNYKHNDTGDNFEGINIVLFARNACFDIAKKLGYKYFMELDDDYKYFELRFNNQYIFKHIKKMNLDYIINYCLEYYKNTNITVLAFAQSGDFIGGALSFMGSYMRTKRKAMNTMLCSTERPFNFFGRINEDVNTYTRLGEIGKLFLTINCISVEQQQTQSNINGLTNVYLELGTYIKSFYSVMYSPSCVKIHDIGFNHKRIHHKITWKNAVPCIVNEKYKR